MSDILLKDISPDGVEVTSCFVFDQPNGTKMIEIYGHRIDMPTGIGPTSRINVRISAELYADEWRTDLVDILRRKVKEAFKE